MNRLCLLLLLISFSFPSQTFAQNFFEVLGTPFTGVQESSIAFADVDGDNDQDLLITGINFTGQPPSVLIAKLYTNDGSGNFSEVLGTPFSGVSEGSIAFADVDGDKDQDVLITGSFSSKLYTNDGSGNFTEVIGTPFQGVNESSVVFADVDGDNDQDVLITGIQVSSPVYITTARLYINNGSGSFTEVLGTPFTGVREGFIAFADVDGDNDQDVLITGSPDGSGVSSKLYTNDGSGSFTEVLGTPFAGVALSAIAFADVDGDKDQDVLITGTNGTVGISRLYTNDGSGNFTQVAGTPFPGLMGSEVAFADVDSDNDQDLLIIGGTGLLVFPYTGLYTNDGLGNFTQASGTPFDDLVDGSVAFADVDGDNDQDVLLTGIDLSANYTAKLYTNDGGVLSLSDDLLLDPSENPTSSTSLNLTPYPNPATSDNFQVSFNLTESHTVTVRIYDTNGRLIRQQQEFAEKGEQTIEVDITALPTGSYFLRLHDGRRSSIARFMVR
ncbi:MAG: T9SS type A sorting domain-containing protein [Bacteroidota bacterium]